MKLLVVDDDRYTREGIVENFQWEDLGIHKVMHANDGDAALQIARWFAPEIVIADIRMPRMDGISFARRLSVLLPESKIIFISGYIEVEYLKNAIDLSAVAFLEKPLDPQKLVESVERAVEQLKEAQVQREQNKDHMAVNRQRLAIMLNRNDGDEKEILQLCHEVEFPIDQYYQCLALSVDMQKTDVYAAAQQVEEQCRIWNIPVLVEPREGGLLVLIVAHPWEHQTVDPLVTALLEHLPATGLGIGTIVPELGEIYHSRRAAKSTLDLAFYDDTPQIYRYEDWPKETQIASATMYAEFGRMLDQPPEALQKWTEELFQEIRTQRYRPVERVQSLIGALLAELYRRNAELYGQFYGIGREGDIEEYLRTLPRFQDICDFMEEILAAVEEKRSEETQFSGTVIKAKNYIASNFRNHQLSVPQVAEHVNYSPPYLNVIFKKEVGVTVKQYIIEYRMQQARQLLEKEHYRIAEIADKCGYSNANYFSKAFRETFGVSPGDYKGNEAP